MSEILGDTRIGGDALLRLIRLLRRDLRDRFDLRTDVSVLEWLGWLLGSGQREYAALREDPAFLNQLSKPTPFGVNLLRYIVYANRPDLRQVFRLPEDADGFERWFLVHGVHEYDFPPAWREGSRGHDPACERVVPEYAFGVHLIGHVYAQTGIGEDVRTAARALLANHVPISLENFDPGPSAPQKMEIDLLPPVQHVGFHFNLVCMTAIEHARFFLEAGRGPFRGRYTIGYWPWELANWPRNWAMLTDLVDEIWVASKHIHDALSQVAKVPVLIMPMAVDTDIGENEVSRAHFDLPVDAVLFCYSFDLNSSFDRKNPDACIQAFQRAFPDGVDAAQDAGRQVVLVVKVHPPRTPDPRWDALKRKAALDRRIHIIEETLDRADTLRLYAACDAFVSLHRAEGFGRGIAEAMQMGLEVIATDYSGNMQYCTERNTWLVPHVLTPVGDAYPDGDGQYWAQPDVPAAALAMRAIAAGERKGARVGTLFSYESVGARYADRLHHLWESHSARMSSEQR